MDYIRECCEHLYYDTCIVCVYVHMGTYYVLTVFFISAPKPTATVQPAKEQFLISPITGECIPASKMTEHVRYGM